MKKDDKDIEIEPGVRANPEIDESLLTPAQKAELHQKPHLASWLIFVGVILALMAVCVVVILATGNAG